MDENIKRLTVNSLVLTISALFAFIWTQNTTLHDYTLQLVALIAIVYFVIEYLSRSGKKVLLENNKTIQITTLSFVVFILVFSTGGFDSPIFFLVYFLLFGVALLLEPVEAIILAIIATVLLYLDSSGDLLSNLIQISSLFLITPLAVIFGRQYVELLDNEDKINILEEEEDNLERQVKEKEQKIKDKSDIVKDWTLNDFREKLIKIWEELDAVSKHKNLNEEQQKELQQVSGELGKLLESAEDMEKKVEQT